MKWKICYQYNGGETAKHMPDLRRFDLGSLVLLPILEEFGLFFSIKFFVTFHALDGKVHLFEIVYKLLD
jgi:hypothetical protein